MSSDNKISEFPRQVSQANAVTLDSALCRAQFALDPFSGHCFIFRNKKASAIKVLLYDSQGFVLCQKHLSKGIFRYWPKTSASLLVLDSTQLQVLLQNGNPNALNTEPPWHLLTD